MALTGNKIDLILGLKLNEFFAANKRAAATYSKTKAKIEGKPIRVREDGTGRILKRLVQIGVAYAGINKIFGDFTKSQTNLANIASLGVENIDEIGKGIQRIAVDVPVALHDIEAGMYQVVSAGVDSANQITVLEQSARAAKAGLAETTDALNLGSAVIKGYGKDFSEFSGVMDQAFQTVKLGQTTFPELAANIGQVVPLASTLKVETEELFGAFATLTGVTGNTSEVATQLKGVLVATTKPTKELTAAFAEYGGAAAALQELGLTEYLKQIQEKTGGNSDAMAKLIPRAEALNAVLALSGKQFDSFVEKTDYMRDSSGAMAAAFEEQAETLESKITLLDNSFQIFSSAILTGVVPAITTVLDIGNEFFKWFTSLESGSQKALLAITGLTAVLIKLPAIIGAVRVAIQGLNVSLGPAGWLIAGISAAAAAFVVFTDEADAATTAIENFQKRVDEFDLEQAKAELIKLEDELAEITRGFKGPADIMFDGIDDITPSMQEYANEMDAGFGIVEPRIEQIEERIALLKERIKSFTDDPGGGDNDPDVIADQILPVGPDKIERMQAAIDDGKNSIQEYLQYVNDISTDFSGLGQQDLETSYIHRRNLLDAYLADVEQKYGTGSNKYKDVLNNRLELDRDYNIARLELQQRGAYDSIALGAQMMNAFQGQSVALFNVGKAAAIADAAINAYKGASESLGAYPMPFAQIMAAIHLALGLANVAKIQAVTFQAQGKKEGGYIFASDLVPGFGIGVPSGEDGLIAAQIGETVMNRRATQMFGPILEQMNQAGRNKIAYQSGGVVENVVGTGANMEMFAAILEDSVIKAFGKSSLTVRGQFGAKGRDLQTSIDRTEELKVTM